MAWPKQGALWMLLAVILWTAAPAVPCLAASTARHDCCRAMMQNCSSMSRSCCELRPTKDIPAPVSVYAPEHGSQISAFPVELMRQPLSAPSAELRNPHHTPPPDPSPGGISVLRI